jgi:hypothetical protein
MNKIYPCVVLLFIIISGANAQTSLRGMYINNFDAILGNTVKEDSLLQYASDSSFNYLALYDLSSFNLSNQATATTAANFIRKAREHYGIQYIGAVCESYSEFQNKIAPFNQNRSDDLEKFNVFNLEFEFWTTSSVNPGGYYCNQYLQPNNCSCDTSGGFKFYIDQMHKIDSLAMVQGVLSETYLGWFNQGQAQQIQHNVDRILLHAYRTNNSSLYSYSKTRLSYLASNNSTTDIAPIFSSEPIFMNNWLDGHSQLDAYNQYSNDFNADNPAWKQYINVLGYQWFDWGYMPKPAQNTFNPTITPSGPLSFCSGGNVILTATTGNTYLWSNGATTQSITVDAPGNYTCDVTLNNQTRTTTQEIVVVNNNPGVYISAGSVSAGATPLTANAIPGSGSISSYQWKLNNVNISGATTSLYSAVAPGNYTVTVTNSNGCSSVSAAHNVANTAVPEISGINTSIKAYPNPADHTVRIDYSSQNKNMGEITLADMNGRIVFAQNVIIFEGDNNIFVETADFPEGIYFLSIKNEQSVSVEKLIIEH